MKYTHSPFILLYHFIYGKLRLSDHEESGEVTRLLCDLDVEYAGQEYSSWEQYELYMQNVQPLVDYLNKSILHSRLSAYEDPVSNIEDSSKAWEKDHLKGCSRYAAAARKIDPVRDSAMDIIGDHYQNNVRIIIQHEIHRTYALLRYLLNRAKTARSSDKKNDPEQKRVSREEYDIKMILEYLLWLAEGAENGCNTGKDRDVAHENGQGLKDLLRDELLALLKDTMLLSRLEKYNHLAIPQNLGQSIGYLLRKYPFTLITPGWFREQLHDLLNRWTAKYLSEETVNGLMRLTGEIRNEMSRAKDLDLAQTEYSEVLEHTQMVILMMVIRHIHTDAVKKGVYKYASAKKQLRDLDTIIRCGGATREQSRKLFEWHEHLTEAEKRWDIFSLPLIEERYQQIDGVLNGAFSVKSSEEQLQGSNRGKREESGSVNNLLPAIEKLKRDFMSISQLTEHFGVTDRTIRNNLKKHDIPVATFGDQRLVHYKTLEEKLSGSSQ